MKLYNNSKRKNDVICMKGNFSVFFTHAFY